MANIILLIFCLVIGVILRRIKVLPVSAPATLNGLIVNLFVPAITLRYAANMEFSKVTFLPVIAAWLVFVGAFVFFNITKKWTRFDRQTIGALIVVSGISSISFVGYPLFELMYGTVGLQSGIVMSQAGTFLICSTVGIFTVSIYSDESRNPDWNKIIRDILKFPPFIALLLAVFIKCTGYNLPFLLNAILEKLGSPMGVAALLSIGLQMEFSMDNTQSKALIMGLFFKLIAAPLFIFFLFFICLQNTNIASKVSVVGSALGSMNTIGIVAISKGLNPPLVSKMLAISIPLSLILAPFVYWILNKY